MRYNSMVRMVAAMKARMHTNKLLEQGGTVGALKLLISEILIALLIGALPLLIAVKSNPNSDIVKTLSALNSGDPVVIHFFYLLLLHLFIWAINKYILKTKEQVSNFFSAAHRFSHQIGFTIHSIYRAIVGAIQQQSAYSHIGMVLIAALSL